MKYVGMPFGMPFGMWALFAGSFQKQLTAVLDYDADTEAIPHKNSKLRVGCPAIYLAH